MTLDTLKARRAEYAAAKEQHEAKANACVGAVAALDEIIAQLQQSEPAEPSTTQEPSPP
jgi:hypothetical protein